MWWWKDDRASAQAEGLQDFKHKGAHTDTVLAHSPLSTAVTATRNSHIIDTFTTCKHACKLQLYHQCVTVCSSYSIPSMVEDIVVSHNLLSRLIRHPKRSIRLFWGMRLSFRIADPRSKPRIPLYSPPSPPLHTSTLPQGIRSQAFSRKPSNARLHSLPYCSLD